MKKVFVLLVCALLLTGCSAQETFETLGDDPAVSASAPAQIQLLLPEEAAESVMEGEDGSKLYQCDGYHITLQTLSGGDIAKTFREVSGYEKADLTVLQTKQDHLVRYESAWCTAGEGGEQSCRTVIVDDGAYHYAVTVMGDYKHAGALEETWQEILASVKLSTG